jgi:hypothetical protein
MDILAPIIEAYPRFYVDCVEDANNVGEAPTIFLEIAFDYEERIKQRLLKLKNFHNLKQFI